MSERRGSRGWDPSQQNRFTGRMMPPMLREALHRALEIAGQHSI